MARFGKKSKERLATAHADLQIIANEVIKVYDFTVLEGHRSIDRQNQLFHEGKSKIDGTTKKGKHNYAPSLAIDIAPYPIDWNDRERFYFLAGLMIATAERLKDEGKINHSLRWCGDWDMDGSFKDQRFDDLPHFELK